MDTRGGLIRAVELLLLAIVIAVVAGQLLGQPVLLSYVETGSMEPTLHPGDGFIAVPMAVGDSVEPGDVIVFRAEHLQGGGLTTHRVVGQTDDGYVTKGDANPFTDQSGGEPPVQRGQIVAKALQVGGTIVVIPNLGLVVIAVQGALSSVQYGLAGLLGTRAVLGTQGVAYLLFGLGVLAYAASVLLEGEGDGRKRRARSIDREGTLDTRLVIVGFALVLVAVITASMVFAGGAHKFEVVSSQSDAPGSRVIATGTSENVTYRVPSNGVIPVVVFLEPGSDGVSATPEELYVPSGEVREATITLTAPPRTGYYPKFLIEHRYLGVLPRSTIRALYGVHPWLPIVAIDALVGGGFVGIGAALVGFGRIRTRTRTPNVSLVSRFRRWLR